MLVDKLSRYLVALSTPLYTNPPEEVGGTVKHNLKSFLSIFGHLLARSGENAFVGIGFVVWAKDSGAGGRTEDGSFFYRELHHDHGYTRPKANHIYRFLSVIIRAQHIHQRYCLSAKITTSAPSRFWPFETWLHLFGVRSVSIHARLVGAYIVSARIFDVKSSS